MNTANLNSIFANYIERFDYITYTHEEIYKWQIAKEFRAKMDAALAAPDEEFGQALLAVKNLTENLIDSYTQPFQGLCKYVQEKGEAEHVRSMLKALLSDDNGSLSERSRKNREFIEECRLLRETHYPGSFLYKEDYHSTSLYVFLYDPEHNYAFKASHALKFADCIEFYDDWGSGADIKLDVFYRMCEALVEEIKKCPEVLAADATRFIGKDGKPRTDLHPDVAKHILAFDIIYACSTYDLFTGIHFSRPNSKEKAFYLEQMQKAAAAKESFEAAKGKAVAMVALAAGKRVIHKTYGPGTVQANDGKYLDIVYDKTSSAPRLDMAIAVGKGMVVPEDDNASDRIKNIADVLVQHKSIENKYAYAERDYLALSDYID